MKYATKKESKDAIGADRSNLVDKNDFIVLKAEVDKLNVNKLVKVLCGLNDLKTKVDYFDVSKLKTFCRFEKIDWYSKEIVKNTKFNKLNTKVNNLENEIPDAST